MASIKQFGIDLGIYGPLAQPKTIIELAKFSEKVGFDSIWLADHVVFPSAINSKYPYSCLLYTSPSPRDLSTSRMPSSA